jgi:uncharacterized protein (TIGR02145 family)
MKKSLRKFFGYLLISIVMSIGLIQSCDKEDEPYQIKYGEGVTDIDGNQYISVIIGTQEWMAENLKTTRYSNGSDIPNITGDNDWLALTTGACCWYENNYEDYGKTYGALYNWHAVNNGNLCPDGWRVPTDADWEILEGYTDSRHKAGDEVWTDTGYRGFDAGKNLKASKGWDSGNGNDKFGFEALPGGNRFPDGSYWDEEILGFWWTSSFDHATFSWQRQLFSNLNGVYRSTNQKNSGLSVRCLKN